MPRREESSSDSSDSSSGSSSSSSSDDAKSKPKSGKKVIAAKIRQGVNARNASKNEINSGREGSKEQGRGNMSSRGKSMENLQQNRGRISPMRDRNREHKDRNNRDSPIRDRNREVLGPPRDSRKGTSPIRIQDHSRGRDVSPLRSRPIDHPMNRNDRLRHDNQDYNRHDHYRRYNNWNMQDRDGPRQFYGRDDRSWPDRRQGDYQHFRYDNRDRRPFNPSHPLPMDPHAPYRRRSVEHDRPPMPPRDALPRRNYDYVSRDSDYPTKQPPRDDRNREAHPHSDDGGHTPPVLRELREEISRLKEDDAPYHNSKSPRGQTSGQSGSDWQKSPKGSKEVREIVMSKKIEPRIHDHRGLHTNINVDKNGDEKVKTVKSKAVKKHKINTKKKKKVSSSDDSSNSVSSSDEEVPVLAAKKSSRDVSLEKRLLKLAGASVSAESISKKEKAKQKPATAIDTSSASSDEVERNRKKKDTLSKKSLDVKKADKKTDKKASKSRKEKVKAKPPPTVDSANSDASPKKKAKKAVSSSNMTVKSATSVKPKKKIASVVKKKRHISNSTDVSSDSESEPDLVEKKTQMLETNSDALKISKTPDIDKVVEKAPSVQAPQPKELDSSKFVPLKSAPISPIRVPVGDGQEQGEVDVPDDVSSDDQKRTTVRSTIQTYDPPDKNRSRGNHGDKSTRSRNSYEAELRSYQRDRQRVQRDRSAEKHRNDESKNGDRTTENTAEKLQEEGSKKMNELLTTKTGGAYIPPAKLRAMQAHITDKSSIEYQRIAWESLKKSMNGLVNKVNTGNLVDVVRELLQENIVRGQGALCRSIMQAQAASPTFTHVYAALVAIINTKFPQTGELLLKRLVIQFRRGFRRNDKDSCLSSVRFLAHLVNQQVAHEVISLQILTILLETPTDDSVEVAVEFLKQVGAKLMELSPRGLNAIFDSLRHILHESGIDKRVQYMIEVMFAVRKDNFKDFKSVDEALDLVDENDQFTHMLALDDELEGQDQLNVFKFDELYEENEEKYKALRQQMLEESSSEDESGSESGGEESEESQDEEAKQMIIDSTETNMVALRRIIYLTIQSSLDFEECTHKILKLQLKPGQEVELCNMVLDCCAQLRTYEKFYGLLAQRLCQIDRKYIEPIQNIFKEQYETIHRLETDKLRNIARFFAHLIHTDAISWGVLSICKLNEEDTTSASRIFLKILFQELSAFLGVPKLNMRLQDPTQSAYFEGILPHDNPKNTRFAINFFTTIGLGGLTEELREHLTNATQKIQQQKADEAAKAAAAAAKVSSSSSDSSDSDSSGSSSDSDSDSSSSEEESSKHKKRQWKGGDKKKAKKTDKKSAKKSGKSKKNKENMGSSPEKNEKEGKI